MQVLYETDCLTGNFSEKTENVRTKELCRGRFLFFNDGIAYRKSVLLSCVGRSASRIRSMIAKE